MIQMVLERVQVKENVIMSPISYFGKRRLTKNASLLHAVAFDLDGRMKRID